MSSDPRLGVAPVVGEFAVAVTHVVGLAALWVGGSLATGDFHPGVSDLDLVAVLDGPVEDGQARELAHVHRRLARRGRAAEKLHCAYVPRAELSEVAAAHLTWAAGRLYRRPLSGIARAELIPGPHVGWWLPASRRVVEGVLSTGERG